MIWPFKRTARPSEAPPPAVALDGPALFADPYPLYAALRARGPVAPVRPGGHLLLSHAAVLEALRDPALGNAPSRFSALHERHRGRRVSADLANNILPFLDAPRHAAARNAVARAFGRRLKAFGPALPDLAAEIVARPAAGQSELVRDVSSPFAVTVMTRFLGLPDASGPDLKRYTESFFRLFAPLGDAAVLARVDADLAAFRAHLSDAMDGARVAPEGLLAADPGEDSAAFVDNAILLFADGIENVERGMASILHLLAREGRLDGADDPRALVGEALRLETPAQVIARVATRETVVAGQAVGPGTPVFLGLGAANRDPAAFPGPDRFDPARDLRGALTFGQGRHSCLGAALAESQFLALLGALRDRGVRVPAQEVRHLPRVGHRWPEALRVELA